MSKAAPLIIVFILLFIQAIWIFIDARKRGENYWLWGLLGLINVPSSLIIYLIVTRSGQVKCGRCKKSIKKGLKICPYCGEILMPACPQCGMHVEKDWKYCPSCNKNLKEE